MHACIHTYIHTYIHPYAARLSERRQVNLDLVAYIRVHTYPWTHEYVCMRENAGEPGRRRRAACRSSCTHMCTHIYVHINMYACVHVYAGEPGRRRCAA